MREMNRAVPCSMLKMVAKPHALDIARRSARSTQGEQSDDN